MPTSKAWTPPRRMSLIEQTIRALAEGIQNRIWRGELPGERVLCERLNVSRPTLRSALAELEESGLLTRMRGCRRRIKLSSKAGAQKSRISAVGLLSPIPMESMAPFALNWIDVLRTRLSHERCALELHVMPRCFGKAPAATLAATMARLPARAWILFQSSPALQKWFQEHGVPCVLAGSPFKSITLPSIDVDYKAACRHAGGVLKRRGHQKVFLLLPEGAHAGDAESIAGLSECYTADKIQILRHDGSRREIVAHVDTVLAANAVKPAFIVARSAPVLSVLTRLLERGLRLPEDAAVISRDDDAHLDFLTPRVTRYRASPQVFARHLSDLCIRLLRGRHSRARARKLLPEYLPGETA